MTLTKKQLEFKQRIITKLKKEQGDGDLEQNHLNADRLLCELLEQLDCKDVVEEFNKVGKWYS